MVFDCVVVGAGVEGSATAYQLAKQGKRTLLIEQFNLPHTRGSSHGATRIIRKAYTELVYANMMKEAYTIWKDIERQSKTTLFHQTGLLYISKRGTDGGPTGKTANALKMIGADFHTLDSEKLNRDFPMLRFGAEFWAVYDPEAGVLMADKALAALQELFVTYGGLLHDAEKVLSITPGDVITIQTDKNRYQTKSVILAAGPWSSSLLKPLGLELPLKPVKISVNYWKEKQPGTFSAKTFPTLVVDNPGMGHFYSLPALEYPNMMKVCLHNGPEIDPDKRDEKTNEDKKVIDTVSLFVRSHIPGLEDKPSKVESCIYTYTPDEDFILDRHPKWKNIIIAAGFSGHGFKLAPVVDKVLGELALDQQTSYDLKELSIGRFDVSNKSKL